MGYASVQGGPTGCYTGNYTICFLTDVIEKRESSIKQHSGYFNFLCVILLNHPVVKARKLYLGSIQFAEGHQISPTPLGPWICRGRGRRRTGVSLLRFPSLYPSEHCLGEFCVSRLQWSPLYYHFAAAGTRKPSKTTSAQAQICPMQCHTGLPNKACPRLRDLASAPARGITQPRTNLIREPCILQC